LAENREFFLYILVFDAPVIGDPRRGIAITFGTKKQNGVAMHMDGEKTLTICLGLAVSTECQPVTDRRTSCDSIVRYA